MPGFQSLKQIGLAVALTFALPAAPSFAQVAPFATWLEALRIEALDRGISAATLEAALAGVTPIERVVQLDRNQPEVRLTLARYLSRVATDARVAFGRQKLDENRALFDEIAQRYGVQPRFIVAFWAVESDFGRATGGFSVIQALATLAFDDRRSAFFRGQLLDALQILDEGHIALGAMQGSWAGAMGQPQFLPSVFLNSAVDFDGDGQRDIWNTTADTLASAANHLRTLGWLGDQTWGRPITLPPEFDLSLAGLGTSKPIGAWQALGVRRPDGTDLPARQLASSIILPDDGAPSPAYLVYNNYRSILRWNRSTYFALAIGSLADRIGDGF